MRSILLILLFLGFAACKRTTVVPSNPVPTPPPPNLRFSAYDGGPKKTDSKDMLFQIESLDRHQPSEFLRLGQTVPNTQFKLTNFQYKTRRNAKTGDEEDASELTLVSTETNQVVVLTLPQPKDSPPTF